MPADVHVKIAAPASTDQKPAEVPKWYYNINDEAQLGPVATNEITALIRSGVIKSDTLLWCHELAEWTSLNGINNPEWKACLPPPPLPKRTPAPVLVEQYSAASSPTSTLVEESTPETDSLPGVVKIVCPICHKKIEPVRIYRDKDIMRCPLCGYTGSDLQIDSIKKKPAISKEKSLKPVKAPTRSRSRMLARSIDYLLNMTLFITAGNFLVGPYFTDSPKLDHLIWAGISIPLAVIIEFLLVVLLGNTFARNLLKITVQNPLGDQRRIGIGIFLAGVLFVATTLAVFFLE